MQNALSLIELKRQIIISCCLLFFIGGCSDVQKQEVPEKIIPEDKMIDIYTDMIILDALDRTSPMVLKSNDISVSEHIINKFNIDSVTLAQNIQYYNLEFETNAEIYERVTKKIERKKEVLDSIEKVRDSLRKEEMQNLKKLEDSVSGKKKDSIITPKEQIKFKKIN